MDQDTKALRSVAYIIGLDASRPYRIAGWIVLILLNGGVFYLAAAVNSLWWAGLIFVAPITIIVSIILIVVQVGLVRVRARKPSREEAMAAREFAVQLQAAIPNVRLTSPIQLIAAAMNFMKDPENSYITQSVYNLKSLDANFEKLKVTLAP